MDKIQQLNPKRFNPNSQYWDATSTVETNITTNKLNFISYNIWFSKHHQQQRCQALLNLAHTHQPDLICLQEIIPATLKQILGNHWIKDNYFISDAKEHTITPYGVLLLSRHPICHLTLHKLPSFMSRTLLVAELLINKQRFKVATVHLESLDSAPFRKMQLEQIFPLLADADHSVLMGDFNFYATWPNENKNIDPSYQDLWGTLRGNESGYTEDTEINPMLRWRRKKMAKKQVRFDRILLRSKQWHPHSIKRLGTQAISKSISITEPDTFISDHFGLMAQIKFVSPNKI